MRNIFFSLMLRLFNLGKSPVPTNKNGTILVMIDGLSYDDLKLAIDRGYCPFFRQMLDSTFKMNPYYCDPPASTVVTEAELFFGNHANIPGFTWYDRSLGRFVRGNRGADIEEFEKIFPKRTELLKNGSCLLGVFSGGATQFNVSGKDLNNRNPIRILKKLHVLLFVLLNPIRFVYTLYLIVRSLFFSLVELLGHQSPRRFRRVILDSMTRIFLGNITTYVAELELLRETPILFVDYVLYDEFAHEYGSGRKTTLSSLRLISWYCQSLYKMSKATKRNYDFVVFSDHGQTRSHPYHGLHNGRLEQAFRNGLLPSKNPVIKTLGVNIPKSVELPPVYLVPAGSTIQVYFSAGHETPLTRNDINRRYPGLEHHLLGNDQLGWLLMRTGPQEQILLGKQGGVRFSNGSEVAPFGNPFPEVNLDERVIQSLARYASYHNNGDMVIFGNSFADGVVAFEDHKSTHGGFIGSMTKPFILTDNKQVLSQIAKDDHMNSVFEAIRTSSARK